MSNVQFANLSIRFGEKELLDYKELVVGAFLKDHYVRKYGQSSYHFFETKVRMIDPEDPMTTVVWGRFVKETTLKRDQYFNDGEIVKDHQTLESAPTSLFVFFLSDHRIAFVPETRFAPTLKNLETTIRKFVTNEFDVWRKEVYQELKSENNGYTWKEFYSVNESPTVALVPLTAKESIDKFIDRFEVINKLTVHLIQRNQDMNGGALFEAMVKKSEKLNGKSAKFEVKGDSEEGLDLENTKTFVSETTADGYERVSLKGEDKNGDVLRGSNEDFKLSAELNLSDLSDDEKIKAIAKSYQANKDSGLIKVTPRDHEATVPMLVEIVEQANE